LAISLAVIWLGKNQSFLCNPSTRMRWPETLHAKMIHPKVPSSNRSLLFTNTLATNPADAKSSLAYCLHNAASLHESLSQNTAST
jgi:hypothetical protein